MDERNARHEHGPPPWYGWGSPIGLGAGLLSVGGFFVLLALGLAILASID